MAVVISKCGYILMYEIGKKKEIVYLGTAHIISTKNQI